MTERFDLLSRGSRSAPSRQQTLRGSVQWSFELRAEPERLLWARVSVFVDGFELNAVEGVCTDDKLSTEEVLDVLAGLVDESILVRDDPDAVTAQYRMLETLRAYGHEKLRVWGELDQLCRRYRDWYTDLTQRFDADLINPRQPDWFTHRCRLRTALPQSGTLPNRGTAGAARAAGQLRIV